LISKVISSIKTGFDLDEVILYGSYAKGTADEFSDIDLAVISPDLNRKSIFGNVRTIKNKIALYEPYLQLTAFPSKSFYEETFIDPDFVQEIKRTGRRVYQKDTGLELTAINV